MQERERDKENGKQKNVRRLQRNTIRKKKSENSEAISNLCALTPQQISDAVIFITRVSFTHSYVFCAVVCCWALRGRSHYSFYRWRAAALGYIIASGRHEFNIIQTNNNLFSYLFVGNKMRRKIHAVPQSERTSTGERSIWARGQTMRHTKFLEMCCFRKEEIESIEKRAGNRSGSETRGGIQWIEYEIITATWIWCVEVHASTKWLAAEIMRWKLVQTNVALQSHSSSSETQCNGAIADDVWVFLASHLIETGR